MFALFFLLSFELLIGKHVPASVSHIFRKKNDQTPQRHHAKSSCDDKTNTHNYSFGFSLNKKQQ